MDLPNVNRHKIAPLFKNPVSYDDPNTPPPDICPDLVVEDSNAEAAIPVMHISLASICFMCNFFLPGSGKRCVCRHILSTISPVATALGRRLRMSFD